ncbi:MAG: BadF/BadG/BcrA/BcrD ATPase family protein [Gemmobacter sp.]|nr:BadF/BadG/BcrA/BcrD ATPase family protein [Gemmobacter sp.]
MTVFLGVDGGGTGCRASLVDRTGRVIGHASGGPANIASDAEGALANILATVSGALNGTPRAQVHAVLGLAGANVAQTTDRLLDQLGFGSTRIVSDGLIALKGALRDQDGIVASVGTGSVFAVQRKGIVRQIGGWGFVLGDEASGAWLGRCALADALRAMDGFTQITPFQTRLLADHGGPEAVVRFATGAGPSAFAQFAPKVIEAADAGDTAALALLDRAAQDAARSIDLLQGRDRLPVVFLGGLGPSYAARLDSRWPVVAPMGSALDGAVWMAQSAWNTDDAALPAAQDPA